MKKNKETVYDFATGLMDGETYHRNLLRPEKAIFSAVMTIVTSKPKEEQLKILGEDAFKLFKESLGELANGNIDIFLDLVGEVINGPAREWEYIDVPVTAFPGEFRTINVPNYSEGEKIKILEEALKDDNLKTRLAVGRVIKEYFPVTEEFKKNHFSVMDAKLFLGD